MKKSILLICLITCILSCKKKENKNNSSNNQPQNPTAYTYEVRIESNFLRSWLSVENTTTNMVMKRYNTSVSDSTKNCPITWSFVGNVGTKYRIYTISNKRSGDTTQYMTDSGLTWNRLIVKKNGTVIYDHKDTIGSGTGYGSLRKTEHDYHINY